MIHFQNRNDIIKWAMDNLPKSFRTIARSFEEGVVEFLGGFKDIPLLNPGWMISVTSKHGHTRYLFISTCGNNDYRLFVLREIDWECWDGDKSDNKLYRGDNPEKYKELKNGH